MGVFEKDKRAFVADIRSLERDIGSFEADRRLLTKDLCSYEADIGAFEACIGAFVKDICPFAIANTRMSAPNNLIPLFSVP